jgi:glucokinase
VNPGDEIAIGVDVGGTKLLGVALDAAGAVVAESRVPTPSGLAAQGVDDVMQAIVAVITDLDVQLTRLAAPADGVAGAPSARQGARPTGVGVPGMVDRTGTLRFAPNLPGVAGADVAGLLGRALGRAVVVENDANLALLAELRLGAAAGADVVLMVTLGTGIGGGCAIGGAILTGASGFAGEVGHMVVDPSGPQCPCGQRGCWERFASGSGLGRLAREAALAGNLQQVVALAGGDPEAVRGEHVTAAALAGDNEAIAVIDDLGWWVALGLANLAAVLDPSRIIIGGGLAEAGEVLLAPTRRAYATLVEGGAARPALPIVGARFGVRAGAVGAAVAAREGGLVGSGVTR